MGTYIERFNVARIASITRKKIQHETLWNLAVNTDESFVANGIVVHNCKSWIRPITTGNLKGREIKEFKPSSAKLEKYIQFSEQQIDTILSEIKNPIKGELKD